MNDRIDTKRVEYIIKWWGEKDCKEIADKLEISVEHLYMYVVKIRKNGINLVKLSRGNKDIVDWDFIRKKYGEKGVQDTKNALYTRK